MASPFVLPRLRPRVPPPSWCCALLSVPFTLIPPEIRFSPLPPRTPRISPLFGYSWSVATARGASLPRSRLEMRLGGARKTRNVHSYIIRDRNNVFASLFSSSGQLRTYRRGVCSFVQEDHRDRICALQIYARDRDTPGIADFTRATVSAIVRDTREFRFINCHKSRYSRHFYFPLEATYKPSKFYIVTRSYICALTLIRPVGFLIILFSLVQLSATYARFRKQSRREEGEQEGGCRGGGEEGGGGG